MKPLSPVFPELASRYRRRRAGRTGQASKAVVWPLEEVLRSAGCAEGDAREVAERELRDAERAGVLELVRNHRRVADDVSDIRLSPAQEAAFFRHIGEASPSEERQTLSEQFTAALETAVPELWHDGWRAFLVEKRDAALAGASVEPFDRRASAENAERLALLPRLLAWEGESLLRFASCVLCGSSKRLESITGPLGRMLAEITGGQVASLDDLGILPNPRSVLVHGPLRLKLDGERLDLGWLHGAFRLSQSDIDRAEAIETPATRLLTVENEATFHELAKLRSGVLLIQTSFPGSATLALLKRLPAELECHHFGDSDEAGFEILRDLRDRSGRDLQPLHMARGRVPAEQESLGAPRAKWPFYPADREE